MDSINSIYSFLENHLPAKSKEKSEFGEVFTPIPIIDNLFDHFPSIWKNPDLKWLEPSSGIGHIAIILFFRLMKSLTIPFAKRAKHIIENMIFMVEINPDNCSKCRKLFHQLCPTAKPNLIQQDFLTYLPNISFDCIIGNPPYNLGGSGLEGSKRTHIDFTEHGLSLLSKNGILSYICPPSYRQANTPMNKLFHDGHFLYIKIYGAQETHSLFHIQGRVDAFIFQLKDKDKEKETLIDDELGMQTRCTLDLTRHIPNFGHSIFDKLHKKVKQVGHVDAFRNTEMTTVKSKSFKCGKHKLLHLIIEKGRRIYLTNKQHSLASVNKILVNGLGIPYVFHDKHGKYGPSQSPIIVLNPTKAIVAFMTGPIFPFICWGLRLTGNNNLPYLFDYVPLKPDVQFTKEEKKLLDEFQTYKYQDKDIPQNCIKNKTIKNK